MELCKPYLELNAGSLPNMELDETELFRERIRDAIQKNGGVSTVSLKTGIPVGTLNKYVAKTSTASFTNAAKIAMAVDISLEEMAYGRPNSSLDDPKLDTQRDDFDLIIELGKIVRSKYAATGIRLSGTAEIAEINALHKELVNTVRDISQIAIVKAVLPELEKGLERRLSEAKSNPGTGKQEAS